MLFSNIQSGVDIFNKGNYDKAIEILLPFAKQNSRDQRVYWVLFESFFKKGQHSDAVKWGIEYLKYGSDFIIVNRLAESFYILKQYENVVRIAQFSNVKHGDKHEMYNIMGMAYFHLKQYKLAEIAIRMANTIHPNYFLYRFNYGQILEEKGDYNGAVRQYTRCVELNPRYTQAVINLNRTKAKLAQTSR